MIMRNGARRGVKYKVFRVILAQALGTVLILGAMAVASVLLVWYELERLWMVKLLIMALLVFIAIVLTGSIIIANRFARLLAAPIVKLSADAKIISGGDLDHKLSVPSGDEVEDLAETFNSMIRDIERITKDKQRVDSELSIARDIQNAMLPETRGVFAPTRLFEIEAKMTAAKEVGGDFYDFFYLDDSKRRLAVTIADVSDKGVPAALFMSISKLLLKQRILDTGDPARALEEANNVLCRDNPRCMFVTVLAGILEVESGVLTYANAGHNDPLYAEKGGDFFYMSLVPALPLGVAVGTKYTRCSARLSPESSLYLYTDGMTEATNGAGDLFGKERLREAACAAAHMARDLPLAEFDAAIREAIVTFADGVAQYDDITSVALLWRGNTASAHDENGYTFSREKKVKSEVACLPCVLDWLGSILAEHDWTARCNNRLLVIAEELFVNIAHYAGATYALFRVADDGVTDGGNERFVMQIEDDGAMFDPTHYDSPAAALTSEGGRGLLLVKEWADTTTYERRGAANVVTVTMCPTRAESDDTRDE